MPADVSRVLRGIILQACVRLYSKAEHIESAASEDNNYAGEKEVERALLYFLLWSLSDHRMDF